jgi:hypothetical protein
MKEGARSVFPTPAQDCHMAGPHKNALCSLLR